MSDAQWQANLDETKRQFDASLDFDKMTHDQKYAYQTAMAILENGQMPSEELLMAAGLSAEDAAKLMAQIEASGGGSGGQKKTANDQTEYEQDKNTNKDKGNTKKVTYNTNEKKVMNNLTDNIEKSKRQYKLLV